MANFSATIKGTRHKVPITKPFVDEAIFK